MITFPREINILMSICLCTRVRFLQKSFLHQNISSLHFLHAEDTLSLSLSHTHTHNIFTTGNIGVFRTEIHEIL